MGRNGHPYAAFTIEFKHPTSGWTTDGIGDCRGWETPTAAVYAVRSLADKGPEWRGDYRIVDETGVIVEEISIGIAIGAVVDEWLPDEGERDPLCAYVKVAATLDGKPITLGVLVGVPAFEQATCRAAGGDVGPFLRTWWADATDWQDIPPDRREEAEEALSKATARLWKEARG